MSRSDDSLHCRLPIDQPDTLRLLQLTDCHLLADRGDYLSGMNTDASLAAICAAITRDRPNAAAVLATGDLSQDGSAESYRRLAQHFDGLEMPVFWIPGNHDDIDIMRRNLRGRRIRPERSISGGNWRILLLDSTLPGETHGRVDAAEIEFMHTRLADADEAHVLIGLHHQAMNIGSAWIDGMGLPDNDVLRAEIRRQDRVRGVVWGHVHQDFRQSRDGVEWIATPSTCIQFTPASENFAIDTLAPAYRILDLHADGRIETRVIRLQAADYAHALERGRPATE